MDAAAEPVLEPALEFVQPDTPEAEAPEPQAEAAASPAEPMASFLTSEESSVFAEERAAREPRIFGESNVFAEEDDPSDVHESAHPDEPTEPRY